MPESVHIGFHAGTRPSEHNGRVSNEFRPGHPVVFWLMIILLTFGFYSGGKAAITFADCDHVTNSKKTWIVFPPEWQCGDHGKVRFSRAE